MSRSSYYKANFKNESETSDNEKKIKGEMIILFMRAGLFLLGLIGSINTARIVIPEILDGDSAVFYFLTGGISICVAVFMMFGAMAGKWK